MKRLFLGLCILTLSFTFAQAADQWTDHSVVGVVTCIDPNTITIATDSGDTKQVTLDPDTMYMKWMIHKSWAEDPKVDFAYLRVGDRVRVRLRQGVSVEVARKVWIVVEDRPVG